MDDNKVQFVSHGVSLDGLLILLGTIFCILEAAGVISWGWVLCCVPFMILAAEIGLALVILLVLGVIYLIMYCSEKHNNSGILGD